MVVEGLDCHVVRCHLRVEGSQGVPDWVHHRACHQLEVIALLSVDRHHLLEGSHQQGEHVLLAEAAEALLLED